MPKQTHYVSLSNATVNRRSHRKEVQPNEFQELKNFYISPSDMVPTLRPPLVARTIGGTAYPLCAVAYNEPIVGLYNTYYWAGFGTSGTDLMFSKMFPYKWLRSGGTNTSTSLAPTYTTGTATAPGGGSVITGSGTAWVANAASSDVIKLGSDVYLVTAVGSDTSITVAGTVTAYPAGAYTLYKNHTPSGYRTSVHVRSYGQYLIYCVYAVNAPSLLGGPPPNGCQGPLAIATDLTANAAYLNRNYIASDFAVIDGQVVLAIAREGDIGVPGNTGVTTTNYLNRIRWTAPGSYNDFTGVGSGSGSLEGITEIIYMMEIEHGAVVFGVGGVGVLRATGDVSLPFSFAMLRYDIQAFSNPVSVGGRVYFIGPSGLLYVTDGASVERVEGPFDATEFYEAGSPLVLVWSPWLRRFVTYDGTSECCTFDQNAGNVGTFSLPTETGSVSALTVVPQLNGDIFPLPLNVSYAYASTSATLLEIAPETDRLRGFDGVTGSPQYVGDVKSGEYNIVPPEQQASIKDIRVRAYTSGGTSNYPDILVMTRPSEASSWYSINPQETATLSSGSSSCTIATNTWSSAAVGWYFEGGTDGQFYRITNITTAGGTRTFTLDRNSSATQTGTVRVAKQMSNGEHELVFGVNRLLNTAQVRIVMVPRDSASAPTIAKLENFSIQYLPYGERTLRV